MRSIDNILEIIRIQGYRRSAVELMSGMTNATLDKASKSEGDISQANLSKFLETCSKWIEESGFRVVDNFDAFGYLGKAIVRNDIPIYGGKLKFIEVEDGKDYKALYSELMDKYIIIQEKLVNSAQERETLESVAAKIAITGEAIQAAIEIQSQSFSEQLNEAAGKIVKDLGGKGT